MLFLFFFNDTATTEIYTLSLHDALPIWNLANTTGDDTISCQAPYCDSVTVNVTETAPYLMAGVDAPGGEADEDQVTIRVRSEEHTSELQSRQYLVCRLLLEQKKH